MPIRAREEKLGTTGEEKLEGEISQESEADEFLDSANELHFWIAK